MINLAEAVRKNRQEGEEILRRVDRAIDERASGKTWAEIVRSQPRPLIPELVSRKFERLAAAGSQVRREEAKALHDEGMTMEQIAELFGVTRQRVSALLKEGAH